jgi:DNA/RNA-binding domain of Phe-tRNA-synthetase-like protein
MRVSHSPELWRDFPELAAGVVAADGITPHAPVDERIDAFCARAAARLAAGPESELAEIQAWRRTYSRLGLKPTQYRCASEALLRRYRIEGVLPRIHPLIDLCNAVSMAFAIPVAALDRDKIADPLEIRYADGTEDYETFSGELQHPAPGEVTFADAAGRAHARRWSNRQSGASAVRDGTTSVLVVAEALHDGARADLERLVETLADEIAAAWNVTPRTALLSADAPAFEA